MLYYERKVDLRTVIKYNWRLREERLTFRNEYAHFQSKIVSDINFEFVNSPKN